MASLPQTGFDARQYLPERLFEAITDLRIQRPEAVRLEAERRQRREPTVPGGRLMIVATDHPGRRVTALRGDPLRMGDRHEYLARALRVLSAPGCDGIMGTSDFMEELLLLSFLVREAGGPGLLDGKLLLGCMNRGGHADTEGEIDDRFTSFTAPRLKELRFQGGKMMYRLDPADPRSIQAIDDCARAVTELFRSGLLAFLEPLSVERRPDGNYAILNSVEHLVRNAGAAAALGESSLGTWLKLPYIEGYERVARSTTLPILMLGGPAQDSPLPTLTDFQRGMQAGANVRGVMVGRNVTFARDHDPRGVAAAVAGIVHDGLSLEAAQDRLAEESGRQFDLLAKLAG